MRRLLSKSITRKKFPLLKMKFAAILENGCGEQIKFFLQTRNIQKCRHIICFILCILRFTDSGYVIWDTLYYNTTAWKS